MHTHNHIYLDYTDTHKSAPTHMYITNYVMCMHSYATEFTRIRKNNI